LHEDEERAFYPRGCDIKRSESKNRLFLAYDRPLPHEVIRRFRFNLGLDAELIDNYWEFDAFAPLLYQP
jgi:hypothetical protein